MPNDDRTRIWILDRFDTIYPAYRVAFERFLVTLRRDFDGDLDAMLILLSISLGTRRKDWQGALHGQIGLAAENRLTNTQSIAETTGIPRESVRRKLVAMKAKGWVRRAAKGNWEPTLAAAEDLRASSAASIAFVADIVDSALAARPETASIGVKVEE